MSHFTVAVFSDGTKTVEELLAPYQENNMGDCPKEYLKFNSVTEEKRNEYENDVSKRFVTTDGGFIYPWDDRFKVEITKEQILKEGCKESTIDILFHQMPGDDEEWIRGAHLIAFAMLWDTTIKDEDEKRYGFDANPYVFVVEFERIEVE